MFGNSNSEISFVFEAPLSNHQVYTTVTRLFADRMSSNEIWCLVILAVYAFILYCLVPTPESRSPKQTEVPYFHAIGEQELKDLLDEENMFLHQHDTALVSSFVLKQAETRFQSLVSLKRPQHDLIVGEVCYQPLKIFEFWLSLNPSTPHEERTL